MKRSCQLTNCHKRVREGSREENGDREKRGERMRERVRRGPEER